jgi:hypothetical protein
VVGVDKDDFVVLVNTILVHPVRVEYPQIAAPLSNTLLSSTPQSTLELEVVDTLADGFTEGSTLSDRLFAVTAAHTDTVDDIALLGLVAKAASLVGARRAGCAVDNVQLTILPAPLR